MSSDEVTCRQFVELVTDYFEGALEDPTLTRVEEHLVLCDWCVTYVDQLRDTIAALGQLPEDDAADAIVGTVLSAVRRQR